MTVLSPVSSIAASGMRAAAAGMQVAAHNVANLVTPGHQRQGVSLAAEAKGGVSASVVNAAPDPAAPVSDLTDALAARQMFQANVTVLHRHNDMIGSLLDVSA
jgi:flagellar basal body rod protein FlgC